MSGGLFDYEDMGLKDRIFPNDKCENVFEDFEISGLVYDLFDLLHEFDWYKSGDTDEEDYLAAKQTFKEKWLGDKNERAKRIIDTALAQVTEELYDTFGTF